MNWQAIYHPDVEKKDLPKIPRNLQERIKHAIELRLLRDPALAGRPLRKSLRGHRRLRVGDYRVIYRIEGSEVVILIIGHRNEVYQRVSGRKDI